MHRVKFGRDQTLLNVFDNDIQKLAKDSLSADFDAIVPIPLSRANQWRRGFNQSQVLAEKLARSLERPVENILRKKKQTTPQSSLKSHARKTNVKDSFMCRTKQSLKGQRILLVDDVYTTGATANECARVLQEAGANNVSLFALARSERNVI